jgi:hypothetical protein
MSEGTGGFVQDAEVLRSTSDRLIEDLDALGELEAAKRETPQGDPRLVELASRIEAIASRVLAGATRQRQVAEAIHEDATEGDGDPRATIAEAARPVSMVLEEWRAAERMAMSAAPGSPEAIEAQARIERLREEYRTAFEAARHQQ